MLHVIGPYAAGFWNENDDWISALLAVAVAGALAFSLERLFQRRGRRMAEMVVRGELTPEATTRLQFLQRFSVALILIIGVSIGLLQFSGVRSVATGLLASGAIAAAVLGFAARATIANVIAGIMIAIAQPLRVGDWVTFEGNYGVVEDIQLNYTRLRSTADKRILIPNERLASGILVNDVIVSNSVELEVSIWLDHKTDAQRAVEVLENATDTTVTIAESAAEGVRVVVAGQPTPPAQRNKKEGELRALCLRQLRSEGLLPTA